MTMRRILGWTVWPRRMPAAVRRSSIRALVQEPMKTWSTSWPSTSDTGTAAGILRGHTVHPRIRLIVIPATQDLYQQALREGLIQVFADAGAAISAGACGPCLGGYMGVL